MSLSQTLLREIESSPIPISTPTLILLHANALSNPRARVWTRLRFLERKGHIRRAKRATTGTFWVSGLANEKVGG